MNKTWVKLGVMATLLSSSLILVGCGGEPEPNEFEIQLEKNIAAVPARSKEAAQMVEASRGEQVLDEEGNPVGEAEGSLNPGMNREIELSILTTEQLKELSPLEQVDIYLNGVLRDEYYVAANLLYGEEFVKLEKERFKTALMTPLETEYEEEVAGRVVDRIVLNSGMNDPDVAHHYVDDVITHLNRTYIRANIKEDFQTRMVIDGATYPLRVRSNLNSIKNNETEFVTLETDSDFDRTEKDLKVLNDYYKDSFLSALDTAEYSTSESSQTLGGFEQNEDGVWVASDMLRLADALLALTYSQ